MYISVPHTPFYYPDDIMASPLGLCGRLMNSDYYVYDQMDLCCASVSDQRLNVPIWIRDAERFPPTS